MKINKFLIVLLALALVFSLALVGCNGDEDPEEPNGTEEPGGEEPGGETDEPGEVEEPGEGTEEPGEGTEEPGDTTKPDGDTTKPDGDTDKPGADADEPADDETTEPPKPAEPEREFVDWSTIENSAIFLAVLVPSADDAYKKGIVTELQADYILHHAIVLGTWPRGSSPGYSDVIYAPATYGYDKVPAGWDGPRYLKAPRP